MPSRKRGNDERVLSGDQSSLNHLQDVRSFQLRIPRIRTAASARLYGIESMLTLHTHAFTDWPELNHCRQFGGYLCS